MNEPQKPEWLAQRDAIREFCRGWNAAQLSRTLPVVAGVTFATRLGYVAGARTEKQS